MVWALVLLSSAVGFVPPSPVVCRRRSPLLRVKEREAPTKEVSKEVRLEKRKRRDDMVESWTEKWDDRREQNGFDWEMEKLRRKLDRLPEGVGGPKFFRKFIEENPDSEYRQYAGSTYPGSKPGGLDAFRILLNNLLQFLGNESEDNAPVASWDWRAALREQGPAALIKALVTGDLQTIVGGPLFLLLTKYHREVGPVFKLAFGPRSFIVVADPSIAKHVLSKESSSFDKGLLSEILKPILGQGLIPADPDVWQRRRRVIAPGFHKKWLDQTLTIFHECTEVLVDDLQKKSQMTSAADAEAFEKKNSTSLYDFSTLFPLWPAWKNGQIEPPSNVFDVEEKFCSTSLDIIGRAVFDYDFGSATAESPLVRAVYRCLAEAEKRTTAFFPFWLVPGASIVVPSLRAFNDDLTLLNSKLDELIIQAQLRATTSEEDESTTTTPPPPEGVPEHVSLLDFLVTMRGEDASNAQLRDDLMTMLVAGHETTAALLTWTIYELFHPSGRSSHHLARIRREIDAIYDDNKEGYRFTYEDVKAAKQTRLALAEGLRLYPQPPLLIRRALEATTLPRPSEEYPAVELSRGTDVFLSTWSLHKSPLLWDDPETYDPTRFERPRPPVPGVSPAGWKGFDPDLIPDSALYPNEQSADYAFLPFGAGGRRCVGDQFAMLEATVMLSTLLRQFDFDFALNPGETLKPQTGLGGLPVADVGMRTGATIHTEKGLWMKVRPRERTNEHADLMPDDHGIDLPREGALLHHHVEKAAPPVSSSSSSSS